MVYPLNVDDIPICWLDGCEKEIPPARRYRNARYCSDLHKSLAQKRRIRSEKIALRTQLSNAFTLIDRLKIDNANLLEENAKLRRRVGGPGGVRKDAF